ncbi:DUF177 domain-containing protein [Brevundimonas sp.]|uniref:YceD family protein n=1 Tax=Brevundimonas sp. TaxID=1871086 RepID=UPI0025E68080|nr:DUF177 domain-containing protein [Brevundimonas sp.]
MIDEPPWSERLRLDQIGAGVTRSMSADAGARERVAEALDLASLDDLTAEVSVKPSGAGWVLEGRVRSTLAQTCGVTLEPLPVEVDERFSVDLVEATEANPVPRVIEADADTPDGPDYIEDGAIDLGAYVVEHLALSLEPYPRKPGAEFEPPQTDAEPSPFAVLAQLKAKDQE